MKTPSGTFALKLGILAATATASIVLISACRKFAVQPHPLPNHDRPVLVIFLPPGAKTSDDDLKVKEAFSKLGEDTYNVKYYDKDQVEKWHAGNLHLEMTAAVHSEAAGDPASVDPVNLLQRAAFADFDQAIDFLGTLK